MGGVNREVDSDEGLSLCCVSPLPVSPLLPPSATGEDRDGEEDRRCQRSEDDDDDGHGVSWRRRCGGRKETRGLTKAWRLRPHH